MAQGDYVQDTDGGADGRADAEASAKGARLHQGSAEQPAAAAGEHYERPCDTAF